MPDKSGRCDRVEMLEHLTSTSGNKKGGIIDRINYRSLIVNIRPPKWNDKDKPSQFWIGKLGNFQHAQHVADAVLYYTGKSPFHFKDAVVTYPPLKCIGTPELLSTKEMCSRYAQSIAKGAEFKPQREDFIQQVENVIRMPDFLFLNRTAAAVQEDDDSDREEEAPPMEFDEHAAKALQMSSDPGLTSVPATVVPTHVAGSDTVRGSDALQAFVPGFEFHPDGSENILRSAGQSLGPIHFSMDDCPTTLSEDEKELRSWNEGIEELDKSIAARTSPPSVVSNAGEVYREGYEIISPILNIPPTVSQCASPLSKTTLGLVAPVERAVSTGTARGNSEDSLSLQPTMNAKRQKIGD